MNNQKLKNQVLFALLAATVAVGGVIHADAASINGNKIDDGVITNDNTYQYGSKLVIGQGHLDIQTSDSVGDLIGRIEENGFDGLKPTGSNTTLVGVVGGEGHLDANAAGLLKNIAGVKESNEYKAAVQFKLVDETTQNTVNTVTDYINKGLAANTAKSENLTGNIDITVGSTENSPVILGFVGGDASVNTGLTGSVNVGTKFIFDISLLDWSADQAASSQLNRTGNITGNFYNGNVLFGVGSSAALSIGNISVSKNPDASGTAADLIRDLTLSANGKSDVVLNGDVTHNVQGNANLGVWANGGGAVALGGEASSTLNGSSTLNIDHTGLTTDKIDGVSGLIAGGGASISTLGGTATTTTGATNITINNSLTGLVAGGGAAVSLDATAVYNNGMQLLFGDNPNVGNDNGTSDKTVGGIADITVKDAINGGTATAETADTHISLNGNTTAIVTAGGGVAGAWHTYTNRDNTDGTMENNGQPGGTAQANAKSGNVTIDVNLNTNGGADAVAGVNNAVSTIKNIIGGKSADVLTDLGKSANALSGKGMAVGILGGGVATSVGDGGARTSSAVKNVTINLNKGYVVGTFGGGLSANVYNKWTMSAAADGQMNAATDAQKATILINTQGDNDKAIGVFAGGVAVSSEYGGNPKPGTLLTATDALSVSTVKNGADIIVNGKADGIFGGGLAVGNSNITAKEHDALADVQGTSSITVSGGTVENLNLQPIIEGTDNGSGNSFIGYNADYVMKHLQAITDNTAIAGGGMALGMSAAAKVENSEITVNGGEVKGDILGGGIAVDQIGNKAADGYGGGASVGTSTITLNGGNVAGSIYAGGAVNQTGVKETAGVHAGYESGITQSTVGKADVTLNGAAVTGEISGQGYNYKGGKKETYTSVTDSSSLTLSGSNTLSALTDGQYTSKSKIHDFNTIKAAAGSVTKVTGDVTANALIDGGKVTVENGARLDVSSLNSTATHHIAANTAAGSTFWNNESLMYDRLAGYADGVVGTDTSSYDVTYTDIAKMDDAQKAAATDEFIQITASGPLKNVIRSGYNAGWNTKNGVNAGAIAFFRDWQYHPESNDAFGRAAMIGEDGATTGNTVSITRDMADNVYQRLSFTEDPVTKAGVANETGDIWAKYIHNEYKTSGQASSFGGISGDNTYDGALVGMDFAKKGKVQYGAAFHYGSGDGNGTISKNDFDAYGFTLYGSVKDEAAGTNLMADIGYTKTSNDITGHVNGKSVTADRDITAWTVGVRGEKEFVQGQNQIVPYAGLRYMSVNPSAYDSYYDGEKLFHNDADNQNLWFLPVGVSLRNETVTASGWRVVPKVEVAYIWAFGDKDGNVDVDLGTGTASPLFYTVTDDGSWLTSLAVEASRGVWSYGAGYTYQKGDDTKNQKWFVNASYAF